MKNMTMELRNYAASKNYNVNALGNQFFLDMAWGGLSDTDVFTGKTPIDQNRIINTIGAEHYNSNYYGVLPKGIKACN